MSRLTAHPVYLVVIVAVTAVFISLGIGVAGFVYGLRADSGVRTNHGVLCTFAVEHNGLVDEVERTLVQVRDSPTATPQIRAAAQERIEAFEERKFTGPKDC